MRRVTSAQRAGGADDLVQHFGHRRPSASIGAVAASSQASTTSYVRPSVRVAYSSYGSSTGIAGDDEGHPMDQGAPRPVLRRGRLRSAAGAHEKRNVDRVRAQRARRRVDDALARERAASAS